LCGRGRRRWRLTGWARAVGKAASGGLLADRRFRLVLVALTASSLADGLLPVVGSFAGLEVIGSAGGGGVVFGAHGGGALLVSLAGGMAGDRFPRGRVLVISSVVRLLAAATLAGSLVTEQASFGLLVGMAAVYGCADGLFVPVSTALLPDVVPATRLG